ncbi:MAG TPA: M48 family metallopeptidase [Allosphingosinicella sp.]|uniref:M48 family metallopeptidase n=1 Tax=Allosphingosinicella sp. TaxID=2823234 RepID=UPI002ED7AC1B
MVEGWLYDGRSAVRRSVTVAAAGSSLRVENDGGDSFEVFPADLVHIESRGDIEVYGRSDIPGWRLGLPNTAGQEVAARLPARQVYGGFIDRIGLPKALAAGALVSALILFVGYSSPAWLAPLVPMHVEKKIGNALVGDFGGEYCVGAGGQEALNKLAARLSPRAGELNIRVVNIKMVNAAALPGGNIVIFRELISEADGPDEVAGVLGHEIAHVEERHVTEGMIRHLGFGMIVALFGGSTGANADMLLAAGYSRGAEREADERAIEALKRANISPAATAKFFERLGEHEEKLGRIGDGLEYLSTHPMSQSREKLFKDAEVKGATYQPSLSRDEWEALFSICHNKPA